MHIPDGYLSPQTCAVLYGAAAPFWVVGARRVRKVVTTRFVPLLALGAAYCFLVMMFNVPVPDGTTAHAVGGVLVAVLLGPWAAVIAVSVALAIQALFFGDGGVLAFGANCFNLAVVMSFAGYGVYRMVLVPGAVDRAEAGDRRWCRRVRRYQPRRALCRGRVRSAARALLEDHLERWSGAVVRAVPPLPDDSDDGGRAPSRRRGRRVRADRGRDHVPPAGQPADPADQSPRSAGAPRRAGRRGTQPGLRGILVGVGATGRAGPARSPGHGRRVRRRSPRRPRSGAVRAHRGANRAAAVRRLLVGTRSCPATTSSTARIPPSATTRPRSSARSSSPAWCSPGSVSRRGAGAAPPVATSNAVTASRGRGLAYECSDRTTTRLAPDWLLRGEVGLCPCGCIGKRRKGGFVAKTLRGLSGLVRRAMFSDDAAARPRSAAATRRAGQGRDPSRSRDRRRVPAVDPRARGAVRRSGRGRRGRAGSRFGSSPGPGLALRADLHRDRRAPRDGERDHDRAPSSCRSAIGSADPSASPRKDSSRPVSS